MTSEPDQGGTAGAETGPTALAADVVGSGPAVLLLHGQPGTAADWSAVTPLLAPRFTVIAPDRPGYGRTGGPAGGFADNAAAAVALLDRLGIDRAIAVGHSWAGGVAIRLAERDASRVAGLVLVASISPAEDPKRTDRILATRPLGDAAVAVAMTATSWLLTMPRVWRRLEGRLRAPTRTSVGALIRPGSDPPLWRAFAAEQRAYVAEAGTLAPGLEGITCPVAVVVGEVDRVVPAQVGRRLAAAIPGATVVGAPGVGHLLPLDAPGVIAAAVEEVASRV